MKSISRFITPVIFFAISMALLATTKGITWVGFFLLAGFFTATNIFGFGTREATLDQLDENSAAPLGVIGNYTIDHTELYGLFLLLHDHRIFIDIRQDELTALREQQAQYLFDNRAALEISLGAFSAGNIAYRGRKITYIGLHSKKLHQGEVFWDPNGYTLLRGLTFLDEIENE